MNKKFEMNRQTALPFTETEIEGHIVGCATLASRATEERKQMREHTQESNDAIEERLASGPVRQRVMLSAAASVIEQTPNVLMKLIGEAMKGNPSACKVILELCRLEDHVTALQETADATVQEGGLGPLERGMLDNLRKQIERMPDAPDLRRRP